MSVDSQGLLNRFRLPHPISPCHLHCSRRRRRRRRLSLTVRSARMRSGV